METAAAPWLHTDRIRLTASLHAAQAQGLLRDPAAVERLLLGIGGAIAQTVERNRLDPSTAWAVRSPAYWDHFEMDLKEALLGPFSGLDPALYGAVREVIDLILGALRRSYLPP